MSSRASGRRRLAGSKPLHGGQRLGEQRGGAATAQHLAHAVILDLRGIGHQILKTVKPGTETESKIKKKEKRKKEKEKRKRKKGGGRKRRVKEIMKNKEEKK